MILVTVLAIGLGGYFLGRRRAMSKAGGNIRRLHSLPGYYGQYVAITAVVPAMIFLVAWIGLQPLVIQSNAGRLLDPATSTDPVERDLALADMRRIADGLDTAITHGALTSAELANLKADETDIRSLLGEVGVALGSDVRADVFEAAKIYREQTRTGLAWAAILTFILSLGGASVTLMRITPDLRARNLSEQAMLVLLILSSSVAILTTLGIVLSLIFEALHFFRLYPARDFFFNLTWNPQFRGGSDLGIIPLLWGTLYVSFVALLVAVPIGLFAAIYLAEYATRRVRSVAKPVIEILAGIPTIVYGLFALITVGPLLRDFFAQPLGLGTSSSSVMTAGLVMGIMLIPFVSSLSDDVINAVPQAMRDGSYGLGATQSETVRQVILPAALPGIVGSVLLATSRAIGETMIVVMGAGAAAKLDLNPFEAMTTITVKIVSQLTGDTEFASPETLVAFALGLSLFVLTLGLNVLALYVVRKYREQYE